MTTKNTKAAAATTTKTSVARSKKSAEAKAAPVKAAAKAKATPTAKAAPAEKAKAAPAQVKVNKPVDSALMEELALLRKAAESALADVAVIVNTIAKLEARFGVKSKKGKK